MKKCFFILMVALIAIGALFVSCKNEVQIPAEELVSVSFENGSARALSSNLEGFDKDAYYWKYAAKKADASNLISGQTANYDTNPESGAQWIKEGQPGLGSYNPLYVPFKVQGFSQGLWNFRLFAYKDAAGNQLVYSGETTGVLLRANSDDHSVNVIVSPAQEGNGTLEVKITGEGKITLDPVTPGLIPNTKIRLGIDRLGTDPAQIRELSFITEDYINDSLIAGTYKVTVEFTNDDASVIFASGSVISTVYSNLKTTIKGSLTEVVTYADFGADQNPDIITTTIGTTNPIVENTGSPTDSIVLSGTSTKVTASLSNETAQSLITDLKEELAADSETSSMTLNLSVDTTEATETTITYEIGMEAVLAYTKNNVQTQTTSTVKEVDDFVIIKIELQRGLTDVSVIHDEDAMVECTSYADLQSKTKSSIGAAAGFFYYQDPYDDPTDDPDLGPDETKAMLYIRTYSFSPFKLSYIIPEAVAAIGSTTYPSLTAALKVADEGDTVTLLKDLDLEVTKEEAVDVDGTYAAFLVRSFKELTIDGNGKTITVRTTDSDVKHVFSLDANGGTGGANIDNVWNIKNLSINATGFQAAIFSNAELNKTHVANLDNVNIVTDGECIYANGDVTINVKNSSLTHSGEYVTGEDYVYYAAVIVGYDGAINLAGCEISSAGNAIATFPSGGSITLTDCAVTATAVEGKAVSGNVIWGWNADYDSYPEYTGDSVITINSGTYDGGVYVQQAWKSTKSDHLYAIVNIKGGEFTDFDVTENHVAECDLAETDHVVITGGTFDDDPSAYVALGYEAVQDDEMWTVLPITPERGVVSVERVNADPVYFLNFEDSVDYVESGDTINILKDCTASYHGDNKYDFSGKDITIHVNEGVTLACGNVENGKFNIGWGNAAGTLTIEGPGKITLDSNSTWGLITQNGSGDNIKAVVKNITIEASSANGYIMTGGHLTVESGYFKNIAFATSTVIKGGYFTTDIRNCAVVEGKVGIENPNYPASSEYQYIIVDLNNGNANFAVFHNGQASYHSTFTNATGALQSGDTLVFLSTDVELNYDNNRLYSNDVSGVTYDLNGHTLSSSSYYVTLFALAEGQAQTVKNGTINVLTDYFCGTGAFTINAINVHFADALYSQVMAHVSDGVYVKDQEGFFAIQETAPDTYLAKIVRGTESFYYTHAISDITYVQNNDYIYVNETDSDATFTLSDLGDSITVERSSSAIDFPNVMCAAGDIAETVNGNVKTITAIPGAICTVNDEDIFTSFEDGIRKLFKEGGKLTLKQDIDLGEFDEAEDTIGGYKTTEGIPAEAGANAKYTIDFAGYKITARCTYGSVPAIIKVQGIGNGCEVELMDGSGTNKGGIVLEKGSTATFYNGFLLFNMNGTTNSAQTTATIKITSGYYDNCHGNSNDEIVYWGNSGQRTTKVRITGGTYVLSNGTTKPVSASTLSYGTDISIDNDNITVVNKTN